MKFHCERCKTKYSISDERVRGKILKIRCKNCSSVITVREAKAAAPAVPEAAKRAIAKPAAASSVVQAAQPAATSRTSTAGQAALAGAFKRAVNDPDSSAAKMQAATSPVSLEAEWYLSKDGKQEGPFTMEEAHDWVSSKAPEDDLYCWSEGFDDWLPTEKVSHFRGIRVDSFSDLGAPEEQTMIDGAFPPPRPVETPKPLFAATMEAVAKQEQVNVDDELHLPSSVAPPPKPAAQAPPIPGFGAKAAAEPAAPSMFAPAAGAAPLGASATPAAGSTATPAASSDLAIGEASRVVDLAALMANRGNAPAVSPSRVGLPGTARTLGNGTGMGPALNGVGGGLPGMSSMAEPQLAPLGGLGSKRKRRSGLLLVLIGASILIAAATGVLVYLMSDSSEEDRVARGSVGGSGNLGYSFSVDRSEIKGSSQETTPAIAEPDETTEDPKNPKVKRPNRPNNNTRPQNTTSTKTNNNGEVNLNGPDKSKPTGPLDPDEFYDVVKKGEYSMKMCYERSLKKNPLLKVPKSQVDIRIGSNGRVSSVKIANIAGTPLGTCLMTYIKRWKFRETTSVFSGQFPLKFGR